MTFRDYIKALIDGIPHDVYVIALVAFCAGTIMGIGLMGWKKGLRLSIAVLLLEYVFLIYGSTAIFRKAVKVRAYDLTPFWSYSKPDLMVENVMNVVVFVPVGMLLVAAFRLMTWKKALGIGCVLSVGIEVMQLMLKKGFCEVDDVMHNTLGCLMGVGVYKLVSVAFIRLRRLYQCNH